MLTFEIDKDNVLTILKDNVPVDVYTPWDTYEGAAQWAQTICDKYNNDPSLKYPSVLESIETNTEAEAAKAHERAALLEKLGITEDEAKLLLG